MFTRLLRSRAFVFFFSFSHGGALRPQKPYGLLGTGENGIGNENLGPFPYSDTDPELWQIKGDTCQSKHGA